MGRGAGREREEGWREGRGVRVVRGERGEGGERAGEWGGGRGMGKWKRREKDRERGRRGEGGHSNMFHFVQLVIYPVFLIP